MSLLHSTFCHRLAATLSLSFFAVAGCGGGGSSATSASSPTPRSGLSVASSIKPGAVLTKPVVWHAEVAATGDAVVDHVDFLIDDHLRWTESSAPYEFNEGGLFAPWPLGSGSHKLVVRAVTASGDSVETTAMVDVKQQQARGLPTGSYRRTVTNADYRRVRGYRNTAHGGSGDLPAAGPWILRVRGDGVVTLDVEPGTQYDAFYEPYQARGRNLTLYGPAIWLQPHPDQPSIFCEPESSGTYTWTRSGRTLTIAAVDHACADRDGVFVGTWQQG